MTNQPGGAYGAASSAGTPGPESSPMPPAASTGYQTAPTSFPQPVSAQPSTTGDHQQPYAQAAHANPYTNAPTSTAPFASPYGQNPAGGSYGAPRAATPGASGKAKGDHVFLKGFLGGALACVLGLGGFTAWTAGTGSGGSTVVVGSQNPSTIQASDDSATLAETVAAKALPSVASIYVYTQAIPYYGSYGSGPQGSSEGNLTESSLGSGIVLSSDGYILTNYHVIEGSAALKVNIEGVEYDAQIVGTDESSDLAVIKASGASGLTAADIGDSDSLTVGEWVMSIGSPFGLEQSVATGVVSATSRSRIVESTSDDNAYGYGYGNGNGGANSQSSTTIYPNMIQTDAAINPGNSGGALVDADGKVIGVNTLITSYSGNYSGVGFAIPINYAVNIAEQIIAGKTPTHAKLGVSLSTVNSAIASRYGLSTDSGAYVASVVPGSGADSAGVKEGDIVVAVNGEAVTSASDLMLDVREHNPGDTVTITVNRNGESIDLKVTLGSDDEASMTPASLMQSQG